MKRKWKKFAAVTAVAACIAFAAGNVEGIKCSDPIELSQDVFEAVNFERASAGLGLLTYDQSLTEAAAIRAAETSISFSHTRPDGTPWYTVNSKIMYGENLAYGFEEANELMEAWMESPSHKDNIVSDDFETMGVYVFENNGTPYIALEFGH